MRVDLGQDACYLVAFRNFVSLVVVVSYIWTIKKEFNEQLINSASVFLQFNLIILFLKLCVDIFEGASL